jgi:pimeloyl-ACP methyl ester carboxylesterase
VVNAAAPPAWRARTLRAQGRAVAAFEAGNPSGPAVLLLHGLGLWTQAAWDRLVPRLDPALRYVAFDLPGFGASEKADAAYDVTFFRAVLTDVVHELGFERFALIGHSLGGRLAADYAGLHPHEITRLALIAPAGFVHPRRHLALAIAASLARPLFLRTPRAGLVDATLQHSVVDPTVFEPSVVARAHALAGERALRGAFARVYAAGLHNLGPRARRAAQAGYARYDGPVLCAWGRHDRYLPIAALDVVRRVYPQARTLVLEHSAHLAMVEEPDALAGPLREFLAP